jgi:cell division protein FtsB
MRQQINLYQDILIDKPEPFQSRQVGTFLLLLVIGLAIVGYMSYQRAHIVQQKATKLRQQQQVLNQQVSELEEKYPPRQPNQLLQERVTRLEQEVAGLQTALDYFKKQDLESNETILTSLEGLARHPQKGLWLRKVTFLQRGRDVRLAGSALKPELVPEYLKLLGEKSIFGGQVFSRLSLNRLEEQGDIVNFELDSSRGGKR